MDIYEYIACNAPSQCHAICDKYGFEAMAQSPQDMADCMEQLVAEVGEPAMRDLVSLHPDKDLIMETFAGAYSSTSGPSPLLATGCGCSKCRGAGPVAEKYIHQAQGTGSFLEMNQAGIFIIGGLLVITLAIISKQN